MSLSVTLLYGGLTAALVTLLGANVSLLRIKKKAFVGQQPAEMVFAIRAHGNAAEWVPLGLVLLAALELSGAGSLPLHLLGGGLLLARVLHAAGLYLKNGLGTAGATLNYLVLGAMSVWAVVLHFVR